MRARDAEETLGGRRVLVTGGVRSGKSRFAAELCEGSGLKPTLIATALAGDPEMERRIALHKKARGPRWSTVEEPLHLAARLREQRGEGRVVLVDCITLWLSNLLTHDRPEIAPEDAVEDLAAAVAGAVPPLVLVTNEVGWGIIPENALARRYVDLLGTLNQRLASLCDRVILMAAGIPHAVKGKIS